LIACYRKIDGYVDQRPYRYAPLAWREYLENLLRAERLYRAGLFVGGATVIKSLDRLEQDLKNPFASLPKNEYPSLEMGLRLASDPDFHPQLGTDAEWERALAWPGAQSVPGPGDKPKDSKPTQKTGGALVSSEISDGADDSDRAKSKQQLPSILRKILEGTNPWHKFVEGQLIDWAIEWTKLQPKSILLSDRKRAEVFCDALRVRRLAEQAASASWQTGALFEALLQIGDAARRRAIDDLFASDQEVAAIERNLAEARSAYKRVIDYGNAVDMIQRIRIEWPFLGSWKVQRAAIPDSTEISQTTEFIQSFTKRVAELNSRLDSDNARQVTAGSAKLEFEKEYEATRRAFEQVRGEFQTAVAAQNTSSTWRDIDELLAVPLIPSTIRMQLVQAAVARSLEDALQPVLRARRKAEVDSGPKVDGNSQAKPPESSSEPPDRSADSTAFPETPLDGDSAADAAVTDDPAFWAHAKGMALLEWSVLAIAGVTDMMPAALRTAQRLDDLHQEIIKAGQIDLNSDAAKAYQSHRDRISRSLRELRWRLADQSVKPADLRGDPDPEEVRNENYDRMTGLERTLIALPLPVVESMRVANPRLGELWGKLADFEMKAVLISQARRLLDDLDTKRALTCLELADGKSDAKPEAQSLRKRIATMSGATIKTSGSAVVLDGDTHKKSMDVLITPGQEIPPGRAAISFGPEEIKGLKLSPEDPRAATADVTLGVGAEIGPDERQSTRISYNVERGIDDEDGGASGNRRDVEKLLSPSVFYRGHHFPADPIKLELKRLNEFVYVTLRQPKATVPPHYVDQFRRHPTEGYMHYNEQLPYEVLLINLTNKEQKVVVEHTLEQDPESKRRKEVTLKANEKKVVFTEWVQGVDLKPLGQKDPKHREVDLGRSRYLDIDIWNGPGLKRRATKRFRFTHIDVEAYAAMALYDYDSVLQRVILRVRHLGTDPGKGYLDNVVATVGPPNVKGASQEATEYGDGLGPPCKIGRNNYYEFWFSVASDTPSVEYSVKIGNKFKAFHAPLMVGGGGKEKKEAGSEAPKS
jgi:hypothetical protein